MGDYMRKSKRERESSVMEVGRTTMEVTSSTSLSKRRKISPEVQLENHRCEVNSPSVSETSDEIPASECSSNKSSESSMEGNFLRSVDLKARPNGFETQTSTFNNGRFSRETSPTSELCGESSGDEMESTTSRPAPVSLSRKPPAVIMPPLEEMENFLTAAEKREQKRFADKYNFDIVKGVPLEGKYKWVRLQ